MCAGCCQVIHAIEEQVEALANRLFAAGKIKDTAKEVGFYQRYGSRCRLVDTPPLVF
jgi:hypothetical protein